MELAICCDLTSEQHLPDDPICIASRDKSFLQFDESVDIEVGSSLVMQPFESLRMHCKSLNEDALYRLNLQMALYVHPVIRADELALSSAIQSGKISQPTETLESRHRAEAELRSVYTMFISAIISPRITGNKTYDEELYNMLSDIMWVTSRELDRYSGHLRQFIVDDKGLYFEEISINAASKMIFILLKYVLFKYRSCSHSNFRFERVDISEHVRSNL